jgi:Fe-S cluster biogenesis protein NfuA
MANIAEAELRPRVATSGPGARRFEPSAAVHTAGDPRQRGDELQKLIEQARSFPDPAARELMLQCLQAVLALYGDGLARILQLLDNAGPNAAQARDALLRDRLVRSLLLVHGLHPESLESRVRAALDKIRPYLQSHGGNVELVSLDNDVARLRLQGTCNSCPSSADTLELAVRQSIEEACPDLMGFEVDGVPTSSKPTPQRSPNAPRWTIVDGLDPLSNGSLCALDVEGVPVLLCKTRGLLYAYRNVCPACHQSLADSTLAEDVLSCRQGHRFDVYHAGRGCDGSELHLDPLPLLAQGEIVKVSVK